MKIVDPSKIDSELLNIWESLGKGKMRACLFNLIVFHQLSERTGYIRNIVQKVSEKYPCRVLFITSDPKAKESSLTTAVSVVGDGNIACDYIDIRYSGKDQEQVVPFILLPHIIPDLPVSLLWTNDPSIAHPLFDPLSKLATRVIFDSESADNLLDFSQKIIALSETIDTADLNWARTEGWRDLIASLFHSGEDLKKIKDVRITYNGRESEFFCHLKVQSLYLLTWMSHCLKWKFKKATKDLHFQFEKQNCEIRSVHWEKLGPGTIISVDIATEDERLYQCARIPSQYHYLTIQISSPQLCEIPYQYVLGKTATGQTLVKEIITQGTSLHYIEMLKELGKIDRTKIC